MAIQVRRGNEVDFDATKMLPGEWAVSLDTKYVRMCFAPGVCLRMATYEAFEKDMETIKSILAEVRSVDEAVKRIQAEVNENAELVVEYAAKAKEYMEQAKVYAENAEAITGVGIATQEKAGLIKGGDNLIGKDGEIILTTQTNSPTLSNSQAGGLKIVGVHGASEQQTYSGKNLVDGSTLEEVSSSGYTELMYEVGSNDGSTQISGTLAKGASVLFQYESLTLPSGTYYASGLENGSSSGLIIKFYNDIWGFNQYTEEVSFTLEEETTSAPMLLIQNNTDTGQTVDFTIRPMISSVGGEYEKYYGGQPSPNPDYPQNIENVVVSEIKTHGENLANMPDFAEVVSNGVAWSSKNGVVTAKGTATVDSTTLGFAYFMPVKVGTYYVSGSNGNLKVHVQITSAKGTYYYRNDNTFTLNGTERACKVYCQVVAGATVNASVYPMVNVGNTAKAWQPYTETVAKLSEPITLHGIGDVADILTPQNVKRKFAKLVFDGSSDEDWRYNTTNTTDVYRLALVYDTSNFKYVATNNEIPNILCTHYKAGSPSQTYAKTQCITMTSGGFALYDENFNTNDISLYKAWLRENPITVLVELADEVTEELPTADKIAMHSLATFEGTTYVTTDGKIEPLVEVEYGTSKVGGYSLEALNTAKRSEIKADAMTTAMLMLNQE